MEGLRSGRRIIGQVAGHEINLEIEGVQDKINKNRATDTEVGRFFSQN